MESLKLEDKHQGMMVQMLVKRKLQALELAEWHDIFVEKRNLSYREPYIKAKFENEWSYEELYFFSLVIGIGNFRM